MRIEATIQKMCANNVIFIYFLKLFFYYFLCRGSAEEVPRMFQGSAEEVPRKCRGIVEEVPRNCRGSAKELPRKCPGD